MQTQTTYEADESTTYAKTETDELLNSKADETDLDLRATASSVYAESEVDSFLSPQAAFSELNSDMSTVDAYAKTRITNLLLTTPTVLRCVKQLGKNEC